MPVSWRVPFFHLPQEYMEWADVLTMANAAAQRSSPERGLRVAEIGAGPIGLWGVLDAQRIDYH